MREKLKSILRWLVSIPSPSGEEATLAKEVKSFLENIGFTVRTQKVKPNSFNLIGERGESPLLLSTHLDTLPPYGHPHPFELKEENGRFIGRGVVDAKGQLSALLVALSQSKGACKVALTVDEEGEGKGSEVLEIEASEAIVLEPTDFAICLSEAGSLEYEIEVKGKATHSATPEKGENAILKAISLYQELSNLSFLQKRHPLFPPPVVNLSSIQGGDFVTVVPSSCRIQVDIHILPNVDIEEARKEVEAFLKERGATFRLIDIALPYELAEPPSVSKYIEEFMRSRGKKVVFGGMRSWTDSANFLKKGIKSVVFGAGDLSVAHSQNEWVREEDLLFLTELLIYVIDNYR